MMSPTDYFLLFLALCPIFFSIIAPALHSYTFWTRSHFLYHRIGGFIWLFHYALAWYVFLYDYEIYRSSILSMSVPISGVFQIITALYYFRFLPRTKSDPGLYGDKGILTYTFVQENLFFALIQVFGAIYHSHMGYSYIRSYDIVKMMTSIHTSHEITYQQWMDVMISVIITVVECVFVFLPFQLIRRFFPKTSFTAAFNNRDQNTTKENREFYTYSTYVIKIFYMAAKHLMAGEILYIRFMDRFDIKQQYWLNFMLICSGGTLYVAVFMHTLRFKKIINPVHGYGIYLLYWLLTMLPLYHLRATLFAYPIITSLVMIALSLNFTRRPWLQGAYQWMLVGAFYAHRYQYLHGL